MYEFETYRQLEVAELQLLVNLSLEFSDRPDSELDHEISLPLSSLELLPSRVDSASPLIAAILSTAGASYSKNHPADSMKLLNTCAIPALPSVLLFTQTRKPYNTTLALPSRSYLLQTLA